MKINKILFITLSNMGDVFLTLPVLDSLRASFPESKITVMVGPRPKEIFQGNHGIDKLIIYDQNSKLRDKIRLFNDLKKERFDIVIDLRNTLFGALLPSRFRTSPFLIIPKNIRHMKQRNLYRLSAALSGSGVILKTGERTFYFSKKDQDYIEGLLKKNGIADSDKIIALSHSAGGENRKWDSDRLIELCEGVGCDYKVVLVGAKSTLQVSQYIAKNCKVKVYDFTGLTDLRQLSCLLKKSELLISCDTGTLQLASYMDVPQVALFGASDEGRYGPWSGRSIVVRKEIFCSRCHKAQCVFATKACMNLIKTQDVLRQVSNILEPGFVIGPQNPKTHYKRILVVRTDRIGDVLLSTPVIKALRDNYPNAFIAAMVSPYAKEVVEGNPFLDEVIIYDKGAKRRSWVGSLRFIRELKKRKFDLALVLHPTNRVHLITFFAGIHRRIGYNRKLGFLLTDRIAHTKHFGQKHEAQYNLDLLRQLGIKDYKVELFMPIREDSENWVDGLFNREGIKKDDGLLTIHPGASCPSKIWPNKRFSEVADALADKYGFKVLVISGPKDAAFTKNVIKNMRIRAIDLGGKTSVSQLASLLKRCRLLISNDSGPVHIASAVGTPVISIFGRAQKGLSPVRWGPVNKRSRVLHKEVGCIECLAHNCARSFACLDAISVDEVLAAADSILTQILQ